MAQCKDCKGSGEFVSFVTIDKCRTCGGSGRVSRHPTSPEAKLATLLRELDQWRSMGSVSYVEEYLNRVHKHVEKHPELLPAGLTMPQLETVLLDEIQIVWDIASAPKHNRGILLAKRVGEHFGLAS